MATLYDIGFELVVYSYKRGCKEKSTIQLTKRLETLLENPKDYTLHISENTTYELAFTAKDSKARLYIEGIDSIEGCYYDKKYEQFYLLPSSKTFIWFRWDRSDKGMVPGNYYIKVLSQGICYYGISLER